MSYTDSVFEAMSGWTSTGFTMINAVDLTPKTLLFWRTFMQWIGGIGIIAFGISMRRRTQVTLFQIFRSEGKPEDLMPNLMSTGWRMWKIYIFLTCMFTGLIMLTGIPLWDALNLVMVAIATGGFTLHSSGACLLQQPVARNPAHPRDACRGDPVQTLFPDVPGKDGRILPGQDGPAPASLSRSRDR